MNKYIKLKKKYPAKKKEHLINDLKAVAALPPEERTYTTFWYKNGKINFINALRAQRMVDRGEYYYYDLEGKLQRGTDYRRANLKKALNEIWRRKPNILKDGIFDEEGNIICNKCGSNDLEFIYHSDGCHFIDCKYECRDCGNDIYQLIRNDGNQYVFC